MTISNKAADVSQQSADSNCGFDHSVWSKVAFDATAFCKSNYVASVRLIKSTIRGCRADQWH